MKHGPIALIDKSMPVVVVAPRSDEHYPKLKANMQEVLARGGSVIAVTGVCFAPVLYARALGPCHIPYWPSVPWYTTGST
jgi:glucosamine--fructose-6-phosphate aminotransferase (isomerizing)